MSTTLLEGYVEAGSISDAQAAAFPKIQERLGLTDADILDQFDRKGTRPGWAVYNAMLDRSDDLWLVEHQNDLASGEAMRWMTTLVQKGLTHFDTRDLLGQKVITRCVDRAADAMLNPTTTTVKDVTPTINALKDVLKDVLRAEADARTAKKDEENVDGPSTAEIQADIAAKAAVQDPWAN